MDDRIKKILEAAIAAPSGENVQPWEFKVVGDAIEQYNVPERDESYYNWGQRGSMVAHGCAIENMILTATTLGRKARVDYFPEGDTSTMIARLTLTPSDVIRNELALCIPERVTNRKPYRETLLTDEQKSALKNAASNNDGVSLHIEEGKETIERLAYAGSANEQIMLENEALHNFFFTHLTWTKEEDDRKRNGFYIKTLELPPPAVAIFKLIKHRSLISLLNKIGFSRSIGKQNASNYKKAAAFGLIFIKDESKKSFLSAGRVFERVWLTATTLGLSLQPMTGILFMHLMISNGTKATLNDDQIELINEKYNIVKKTAGDTNDTVPIMFRIGYAEPPSAHASRFKLENVLH